jgi:hypothetical protein
MELKQGETASFAHTPCRLPCIRFTSIQFANSPWAQTAQIGQKPRPSRVAHYGSSAGPQAVLDARRKKQFPPVLNAIVQRRIRITHQQCCAMVTLAIPICKSLTLTLQSHCQSGIVYHRFHLFLECVWSHILRTRTYIFSI